MRTEVQSGRYVFEHKCHKFAFLPYSLCILYASVSVVETTVNLRENYLKMINILSDLLCC